MKICSIPIEPKNSSSPTRGCVGIVIARDVKGPKQSHNAATKQEIAALSSVARNDKKEITKQSHGGGGFTRGKEMR